MRATCSRPLCEGQEVPLVSPRLLGEGQGVRAVCFVRDRQGQIFMESVIMSSEVGKGKGAAECVIGSGLGNLLGQSRLVE